MKSKSIRFDKRADKEIKAFPSAVQAKIKSMVRVLAEEGSLVEPYGKKLDRDLFEIRINYQGQWRIIYAYLFDNFIVILSAFRKKTQRTPTQELTKAKNRLKDYLV